MTVKLERFGSTNMKVEFRNTGVMCMVPTAYKDEFHYTDLGNYFIKSDTQENKYVFR